MTGPVLVTGATGFVGRHLVERLAADHEVVAWGYSSVGAPMAGVTWRAVDLLDRDQVRAAVADLRPAAVYHCAGLPHVAESWADRLAPLAANVRGTHYLMDALRRVAPGCRVLVTGSAAIYAPSDTPIAEDYSVAPTSPYAVSKLAQEQLALQAVMEDGLDVVVARSFNHTGAGQREAFFAPGMARQVALIEAGAMPPVIHVGNLDAVRDMSDVRDVVTAYVALARSGRTATIYNVASGVGRSMRSILDALLTLAPVEVRVESDPGRLRPNDVPSQIGDATRLRDTTGWRPLIPFERCLADLLDYWRGAVAARRT
jgi:GDP-4-dehydro-6-deoxy-D-mannose reductase